MIYFHPEDPTGEGRRKAYVGTGFLVGNKQIFTAGHNVYDLSPSEEGWPYPKTYPNIIEFYPGLNEGTFFMNKEVFNVPPLSERDPEKRAFVPKAEITTIHNKWKNNKYRDVEENPYDFAGIILNKEICNVNHFYPKHHSKEDLMKRSVSVTGYPLCDDDEKETDRLYTMEGEIREICGCRVHYPINTSGGQSGSPVWYKDVNGNIVSTAIHIGAHHGTMNTATRLTDWLISYMEDEWSVDFTQKK